MRELFRKIAVSLLALLVLLAFSPMFSYAGAGNEGDPVFQNQVQKLLMSAGQVGIQVASLSPARVIWEYRPQDPLIPASLVKVLTSYAALKNLKPGYRFETSVYTAEEPQGDTVRGDIWIKSTGDLFFLTEDAGDIALKLKERGIRTIQGGVFADNGFFSPQAEHVCLDENCGQSYNPVISATAMQFNTVVVRVSSGAKAGTPAQVGWYPPGDYVQLENLARTASKPGKAGLSIQPAGTAESGKERIRVAGKIGLKKNIEGRMNIHDPASFVAKSFRQMLRQAGVEVRGGESGAGQVPPGAVKLVSHESAALGDVIYGLNRYSNNFMAEMLVRSLGGLVLGPPGTVQKGVEVIRNSLADLNIPEHEVQLDSGSGLSRECRVSARTFCALLAGAYADSSIQPEFLSSFASNGQEGTLRRRVCKPGIIVRGKTGTLRDVVGFAGYVSGCGNGPYAVAVILNDVKDIGEARRAVDAFLEKLTLTAPASGS